MEVQERVVYGFRGFRLDVRERLLTCGGGSVPLPPKAFDLLLVLVRNAGSLVEKEALLDQVWNGVHVEEGNLAKHISLLRKALGETSDGSVCIETVPKIGYRFVAPVSVLATAESTTTVQEGCPLPFPDNIQQIEPRRWIRMSFFAAGAVFVLVTAALLAWTRVPAPSSPRIERTDRLTRSGRAWWLQPILTDGTRLYFVERIGGRQVLASAPIDGGDPVPIPTQFSDSVRLLNISPDHRQLLLAADDRVDQDTTFWTIRVDGGSAKRLGTIMGTDAAWFPDGRRILFTRGCDIYTANDDGTQPQKVSSVNGRSWGFYWSPDDRVLRFTVENPTTNADSIWEANPDGSHPHRWAVFPNPPNPGWMQGESGGVWTPDGRYFVYRSMRGTAPALWAVREQSGFRSRFNKPVMLYTFPSGMAYANPLVSSDGKRIFFVAELENRELMRFDDLSQRFVSYLGGIPARMVDFSRDGRWAAYYSYDYHLWRSRVDGSDRMQLTFSPLGAGPPRWSPDGKRIAFRGDLSPDNFKIYLISPEGNGNPQPITPAEFTRASAPCWSPDGKSIIFGEMPPIPYTAWRPEHPMQRFDLKTGEVTPLAGSEGLNAQDLSPDGQNVVAFTQDDSRLVVYNLASHRIVELAQGKNFYAAFWSRDGGYIYFQDLSAGTEEPISRIRVSDHKIEPVAGLSQFNPPDTMAFSFAGLTSDDSPLASVILNRGDIYALNVDFP